MKTPNVTSPTKDKIMVVFEPTHLSRNKIKSRRSNTETKQLKSKSIDINEANKFTNDGATWL